MKLSKAEPKTGLAKKKRKPINRSQIEFWSMCFLPILFIVIFCYIPMFGIIIAFKDYKYAHGIFGSEWVGFENFKIFTQNAEFLRIIWNTLWQNVLQIVTGEIGCISLAILLYNLKSRMGVKIYQTAIMTPNFLSWVIAAYMVFALLSPTNGLMNQILVKFGMEPVDWYMTPEVWPVILMIAHIWKTIGMGCILYYAALMAINPELFEVVDIDGGGRWTKIRYVMFPELTAIICIKLIFAVGGIFGGDFGLFYQVPRNVGALYKTTDIIPTYIFRMMRVNGEMSVSSAAGLLQSVVGFLLVITTNAIVKKIDPERSLF